MEDYIEVSLFCSDVELREQLVAMLSTLGFDGFDDSDPEKLSAFIKADYFSVAGLDAVSAALGIDYQLKKIPGQNWNAAWESNFEPVEVDDFVYIKAPFHSQKNGFAHTLHIMPKMSFGTGHHATTQLMMRAMKEVNWQGKSIFDFGCGTGVLAILAAKLGAASVFGIDNESWSVENTLENAAANDVSINAECIDSLGDLNYQFDIVLANINLHVLQANAQWFTRIAKQGTQFFFSGLLTDDEPVFTGLLERNGLRKVGVERLNGWIMVAAVLA